MADDLQLKDAVAASNADAEVIPPSPALRLVVDIDEINIGDVQDIANRIMALLPKGWFFQGRATITFVEPPVIVPPPVLPEVPMNITLPTISGTPQVGDTLTADPGTWTNDPSGYTYQWYRDI